MRPSWPSYLIMRRMNWFFLSASHLNLAIRTKQRLRYSILLLSPLSFQPNFVMVMVKWLKAPLCQAILQPMSFTTLHLWPISSASVNSPLVCSSRTPWSRGKISVTCYKLLESSNWDQTFLLFPCTTGSGLAFLPISLTPSGKNGIPISFVGWFILCA